MPSKRDHAGRWLLALGSGALCLLAVAATAAAESFRYQITRADHADAKAIVLKRSDIRAGTGWTGGASGPDRSPRGADDCPIKLADLVITGVARSAFKYKGGVSVIVTSAEVFANAEMLTTYWQRLTSPAYLACTRKQAAETGEEYGRLVSFKLLPLPRIGRHSIGYRLHIRHRDGRSILIDNIAFTRGRTATALTTMLQGSAVDPSLLLELDDRVLGTLYPRVTGT